MVRKSTKPQLAEHVSHVASLVAGEDIRVGQYYAQISLTCEYPSFCWLHTDASTTDRDEPVRITYRNGIDNGPYKVESICLPFLLVQTAEKSGLLLDVRNSQLARVDEDFAKQAWAAREEDKKKKSCDDKNDSKKKKRKKKKRRGKRA